MEAAVAHRHPLAVARRSRDDAASGDDPADRRGAAGARRAAATTTPSATSTGATLGRCSGSRCGGSATAAAPRTPCRRRSHRSGASARSYRPERGPVAPWLYAVARNAIADRGRARIEPPAEPTDAPSDEPGPAERAEQSWVAWRVHRALEELARERASVLELAYWSGLSQSEIADFLGIPLGTVKTRTRSGLRGSP